MKKITAIICIISAAAALVSCSDKNVDMSSSVEEGSVIVTEQETEPETTVTETTAPPPKKTETSDYYGKWVPYKMVVDNDLYEVYYNDVPLEQIYQLEISDDGTAVIGSGFPDSVSQTYSWEFKGKAIVLSGENGIYGDIVDDSLILNNAEGMKVYMERTDEFPTMKESVYDAICDMNGGEIELPELYVENSESTADDYIGKWECSSYEVDGEVFKDELYGVPLNALFQVEIKDDNTAVFNVGGTDEEAVVTEYEWQINDSGCIELYEDGELVTVGQLKDGELCLDEGVDVTRFRSVEKFTDFDWESLNVE